MANWSNLKSVISDAIKTNGNQEITGALLQSTLTNIVNAVGENATFAGIATNTTNPGTPDGPVFYIASKAGTYSNFNNIVVASRQVVVLYNNTGTWGKEVLINYNADSVAYDNSTSRLDAVTTQGALDELNTDIQQEITRAKAAEKVIADNTGISNYKKFDISTIFYKGDIVLFNNELFVFVRDHSGEWSEEDVERWSIKSGLDNIKNITTFSKAIIVSNSNQFFPKKTFKQPINGFFIKIEDEADCEVSSIGFQLFLANGEVVYKSIRNERFSNNYIYIRNVIGVIPYIVPNALISAGTLKFKFIATDITPYLFNTTYGNNSCKFSFYKESIVAPYTKIGELSPNESTGYSTYEVDIFIETELVGFDISADYKQHITPLRKGHNIIKVDRYDTTKIILFSNSTASNFTVNGVISDGLYYRDIYISEIDSKVDDAIKDIETLKNPESFNKNASVSTDLQIFAEIKGDFKYILVSNIVKDYDGELAINIIDGGVPKYFRIYDEQSTYDYKATDSISKVMLYTRSVTKEGNISFNISVDKCVQNFYDVFPYKEVVYAPINVSTNVQWIVPKNKSLFREPCLLHIIDGKSIIKDFDRNGINFEKTVDGKSSYGSLNFINDYAIIEETGNIGLYLPENSVTSNGHITLEIFKQNSAILKLAELRLKENSQKPVVVFDFDEPVQSPDSRYQILEKYGYKATLHFGTNIEAARQFIRNGYDICPYLGAHHLDYTLESSVETLKTSISNVMSAFETLGLYHPVMVGCSGHKYGYAMEKAFEELGYKFRYLRYVRYQGIDDWTYSHKKSLPSDVAQRPFLLETYSTIESIKDDITSRINKGYPLLMLMTHSLIEEGNESSVATLTKEMFEKTVDFIHELEVNGKIRVMTMRQYYNYHFPIQGDNYDFANNIR